MNLSVVMNLESADSSSAGRATFFPAATAISKPRVSMFHVLQSVCSILHSVTTGSTTRRTDLKVARDG